MEIELQTKYGKHNLKKEMKAITYQLWRILPTLVYKTLINRMNIQ